MTLQKRPRRGNLMEPSIEVELEQQVLTEIRGVAGQVRDIKTILFGTGDAGETEYGRIPMVEASVKALDGRVDRLEKLMIRYVALATGAGFVIGLLLRFLWK